MLTTLLCAPCNQTQSQKSRNLSWQPIAMVLVAIAFLLVPSFVSFQALSSESWFSAMSTASLRSQAAVAGLLTTLLSIYLIVTCARQSVARILSVAMVAGMAIGLLAAVCA